MPPDPKPFADVLLNVGKPSLSAASDMPVIDLAKPPADDGVDNAEKPGDVADTSTKAKPVEGEGDGTPANKPGEGEDKTSPQDRAAITRFKNRATAAEQRAAALDAKVAELSEAVAKLTPPAPDPEQAPRPKASDFTEPGAYDEALEKWASDRATAKAEAAAKAATAKQARDRQIAEVQAEFAERKARFEEDHPDFDELVFDDGLEMSPAMSEAIMLAEDGPAIAYHLAQNPELSAKLAKLRPAAAVLEIGKISVELAKPVRKPKPAPEIITPLRGRDTDGPKDPSEMSTEEYMAHKAAKRRAEWDAQHPRAARR